MRGGAKARTSQGRAKGSAGGPRGVVRRRKGIGFPRVEGTGPKRGAQNLALGRILAAGLWLWADQDRALLRALSADVVDEQGLALA